MKDAYSFHASRESLDETYEAMRDAYGADLSSLCVRPRSGRSRYRQHRRLGFARVHGPGAVGRGRRRQLPELPLRRERGEGHLEVLRRRSRARAVGSDRSRSTRPARRRSTTSASFLGKPTSRAGEDARLRHRPRAGDGARPRRPRRERDQDQESPRRAVAGDDRRDAQFEEATGGPVGYCGPVGTKCKRVLADHLAARTQALDRRRATSAITIIGLRRPGPRFSGAGLRRLHDRHSPAIPASAAATPLEIYRGIEVGHIFKLGTKYSEAMHCDVPRRERRSACR